MSFKKELQVLINKHSRENNSNTPDYILAEFMNSCLKAFEIGVVDREKYYGRSERVVSDLLAEETDQ